MRFGFDKILGIHDDALQLRAKRAQVLATNIANADTPDYKARDFDFQQVLEQVSGGQSGLRATHPAHFSGFDMRNMGDSLDYRNPSQPSLDGNTVDSEYEMTAFLKNAMQFQTSFTFLNKRFMGIISAFKGE